MSVRSFFLRRTLALFAVALLGVQVAGAQELPHLQHAGEATQLVVEGEPMLMLGGELGNSSASDPAYMRPHWDRLAAMNLNTVLAPVYWELVEPREGQFKFTEVDSLIASARAHDLRLVLLWFGSWKNSMSSYVPGWVKRDYERFPRAEGPDGTALEILSPFSEANVAADARAFEALMTHLREVDGEENTVVMVQVENEIGMIPSARDHSALADEHFEEDVPERLLEYLQEHRDELAPSLRERWEAQGTQTSGTWEDVFGRGVETAELFMAWHYARYAERVTSAGKSAYPLPMYVNAALPRPGEEPGAYPSAGPLPSLIDVWRAGAPSIDFLAPDVYFPNFVKWVRQFDQPGNPLLIPEAGRAGAPTSAGDAFYAFGNHDAMGYSPFSIEDAQTDGPLSQAYDVLEQLTPLILKHQRQGTIAGVKPPVSFEDSVDASPQEVRLGDYVFEVSFVDPWTPREEQQVETHGGLIMAVSDNEFYVAGTGLTITFAPQGEDASQVGILRIEEGTFADGQWQRGRVLNGDQSHQGRHLRLPPGTFGIQRVELYRYQ